MKKFYLAALTFAALVMNNQVNAQEGLSLNVKAIPQFSFLQNKDDNNNSSLKKDATFDASFGIGAAYNFTSDMGVGLDILYSIQGQLYETEGAKTFKKISYVKFPVYYSYTFDLSKKFSLTGKVGPQLSLRTDSKVTDGNGNDVNSNTTKQYEGVTFGGMIAVGAQYKLNKIMFLTAQPRFDYDFTNAENKNYAGYTSGRSNTYNMTAGLEIGFKYMLNKVRI